VPPLSTPTIMKDLIAITVVLLFLYSCGKKKTTRSLYSECKSSELSFYKGKDTVYEPAGDSPHGSFKLRFNSKALSRLDASGKLPAGAQFENGAVIVKEIYKNGQLEQYAVMKKVPSSRVAVSKWIWAELRPDGSVIYDISKGGDACVSCHSRSANRDLTRSFDLH
jgi:hypothetical protein